jgi:Flp pilus assembly protein TadD
MRRGGVAALSLLLSPWGRGAFGQVSPDCHGPIEIERVLTKQPSADAYNALGAWFAQHDRTACAIPAFPSAIRLRPNGWEGHFSLALALMDERHFKDATVELRQAD